MQCPNCGSENTQRLQVVYEQGTQNINTTSSTAGGGYAGAFGAGIARTSTQGTSQSTIAQKAAPPQRQSIAWFIMMIVIGFLCFGGGWGWKLFGLILVGGGIYFIRNALQFNNNEWPTLFKNWQETWMCNKCGQFYHQAPRINNVS